MASKPQGSSERVLPWQVTMDQLILCASLVMNGHTYSKSMDQPGKVAGPVRGQLNRENEYFPVRVSA